MQIAARCVSFASGLASETHIAHAETQRNHHTSNSNTSAVRSDELLTFGLNMLLPEMPDVVTSHDKTLSPLVLFSTAA